MNTTTATKALETIITSHYGADPVACDAMVIEWAAEKLAASDGAPVAAMQWRKLNARRERLGKDTTIPAYGSTVWADYSALIKQSAAKRSS